MATAAQISDAEECAICLDFLNDTDQDVLCLSTPCGHRFHTHCLLEWLERSKVCPVCYSVVDETLIYYSYAKKKETRLRSLNEGVDEGTLGLGQQTAEAIQEKLEQAERKLQETEKRLKIAEDEAQASKDLMKAAVDNADKAERRAMNSENAVINANLRAKKAEDQAKNAEERAKKAEAMAKMATERAKKAEMKLKEMERPKSVQKVQQIRNVRPKLVGQQLSQTKIGQNQKNTKVAAKKPAKSQGQSKVKYAWGYRTVCDYEDEHYEQFGLYPVNPSKSFPMLHVSK